LKIKNLGVFKPRLQLLLTVVTAVSRSQETTEPPKPLLEPSNYVAQRELWFI